MSTHTLQRELKILTDATRMRAFLRLHADENYAAVGEGDLVHAMEAANVRITPAARDRIREFVAAAKSGKLAAGEFVMAEGVNPTDPRDAQFTFADTPAEGKPPDLDSEGEEDAAAGADRIDFFQLTHIRTAQAGQVLGSLTPPAPGMPGTDVFGKPVPPHRTPAEIVLGENVELAADGRTVRATASGVVCLSRGRLSVQPVIEINGNVDFESGSIDAPTNVIVRGDIQDSFHVRSAGDIAVNGSIGACEVTAGRDIQVRGGIAGKDKARVEARGRIVARFCNACVIQAGGDLVVAKEALNCRLHILGRLCMPRGSLIGGYAYARCGGEVRIQGSDGGVRTEFAMGTDPETLSRCEQIDAEATRQSQAAAKIRETVAPLMSQLKRLLPAQRERATELLCQADGIDAQVQSLLKEKEELLRKTTPETPPFLRVSSLLLPGATIIVGDLMTVFEKPQNGPVRIMRRKVDGIDQLVSVNELTGNVIALHSRSSRRTGKT
ncbi:MAG TPA: FapA family protein [Phycisphaerae bacterium]|nr:FapA family protein [Phycisphaerae bacterium]